MGQTLFTRDGKPVQVDDSQVGDAVRAGAGFNKQATVNMINPNGETVSLSGDDAHKALLDPSSGWRVETGQEREHRHTVDKYGSSVAQEILAGLAGGGRMATFGLSDVALRAAGVRAETLKGLEEANPTATTAGEWLGLGTSLMAGPGGLVGKALGKGVVGTALRGATVLPRASAAVNAATEAALLRTLGGTAGRGVVGSAIRRGAAMGAGSAIEGAAYGAGNVISEAALGNRDLTTERVLDEIGSSALLGGVLGGGLGVGVEVLKGAATASGAGIAKLWERATGATAHPRLAKTIEETIEVTPKGDMSVSLGGRAFPEAGAAGPAPRRGAFGEFILDVQSRLTGVDKGALRRVTDTGEEGRLARARAATADETKAQMARDYAKIDNEKEKLFREITDQDKGILKQKNVEKIWDESTPVRPDEIAEEQLRILDGHTEEIKRMRAQAKEDSSWGHPGLLRETEHLTERKKKELIEIYSKGGTDREVGAELFYAGDDYKRQLGKIINKMERVRDPKTPDYATYEKAVKLEMEIRDHLQDPSWYNRAGHEQTKYNADFSAYLGNQEYSKSFRRPTDRVARQKIFETDPGLVEEAFNRIGKTSGDLEMVSLKRRSELGAKLMDQITESFDLGPEAAAKVARFRELSGQADKIISHVDDTIRLNNQLEKILKHGGGITSLLGEVSGGLGGFMIGGIPGAIAGTLIGTITNPGVMIKRLSTIERISSGRGASVVKSVGDFFSTATKGAGKAVKKTMVPASVGILSRVSYGDKPPEKGQNRREAFHDRLDEITQAAADPEATALRLAARTAGVAQAAPLLADAMSQKAQAVVAFLNTKAPRPPAGAGLYKGTKWEPTDAEVTRFERYTAAANNPTSILQDLHAGSVSAEAVEAVRTLYPELYQEMRSEMGAHLADLQGSLNYGDRRNLSILFGVPIDPTTDPAHMAALQASWAGSGMDVAPGQEEAPRSRVKAGSLAREKTTQQTQTRIDRVLA